MKLDPYLIPYIKITSKLIKDISVQAKTTELFKENTGENQIFMTLDLAMISWIWQQVQAQKKTDKFHFIKIKHLCIKGYY